MTKLELHKLNARLEKEMIYWLALNTKINLYGDSIDNAVIIRFNNTTSRIKTLVSKIECATNENRVLLSKLTAAGYTGK